MYAHRVEVFHGAHGDDVAHAVPHGLELDLLPAEDVLFHQHLVDGAGLQAARGHGLQLAGVVGHAAAEAAQGKGGTDDDGIADALCDGQGGLHIVGDVRGDRGLADGVHGLLEQLAVLGLVDGLGTGTQKAHAHPVQKALLGELHGQGQAGLAPQARQQAVGPLLFNDALDGVQRQRLQIDLVRQGLVGHDGGRVGVDQHHVDPGLFQHAAGLGAGIVELRGLTDDDGAGADDQGFLNGFIQRHKRNLPSAQ